MVQTHDAGPGAGDAYELLCRIRDLQVAANRSEMARARAMTALFQQFSTDFEARRADDPHFTATPLAETIIETQPVTGQTAGRIRADLEAVLLMDAHLPWLAEYVDDGRLDLSRAKPVTDALKDDLADHPEARARFATLMQRWFAKAAAASPGLLNKTITQIRNHVHYVVTKVLSSEFDERFKKRFAARRVSSSPTGDGMAALTIDTDQVSVRLAEQHLDLLARDARSAGDERTLEQLRADLAVDLLTGRKADTGSTGRWARPVINVTVPLQTLMGLSDEPGRMGDQTLPASLVRHVAADPTSTWHRMLTDPARGCVELSTHTYRPTGAIWREVVAAQPTCFAPTCDRPATECDLDHELPWPEGPTSTVNLGPGCVRAPPLQARPRRLAAQTPGRHVALHHPLRDDPPRRPSRAARLRGAAHRAPVGAAAGEPARLCRAPRGARCRAPPRPRRNRSRRGGPAPCRPDRRPAAVLPRRDRGGPRGLGLGRGDRGSAGPATG